MTVEWLDILRARYEIDNGSRVGHVQAVSLAWMTGCRREEVKVQVCFHPMLRWDSRFLYPHTLTCLLSKCLCSYRQSHILSPDDSSSLILSFEPFVSYSATMQFSILALFTFMALAATSPLPSPLGLEGRSFLFQAPKPFINSMFLSYSWSC